MNTYLNIPWATLSSALAVIGTLFGLMCWGIYMKIKDYFDGSFTKISTCEIYRENNENMIKGIKADISSVKQDTKTIIEHMIKINDKQK